VFTDLKNSTRLYLDIGDAPAFGRVLTHFDTLKAAIAEGGGAIVKTMGDAVMATFTEPRAAVESLRRAQAALAQPCTKVPLALKCSIHQGPCLAINQNERLDYFGTTVNVCARLCSISTGSDIVVSRQVLEDPGVASLLAEPARRLAARADAASLRGMGHTAFDFWRLQEPDF
jgi:class 3 adenylate cyclase